MIGDFVSDVCEPAHISSAETHPKSAINEARNCKPGPEYLSGPASAPRLGRSGGNFGACGKSARAERTLPIGCHA
jgi:hypothetical protein